MIVFCLFGLISSAVMADEILEQDAQNSQEQEEASERNPFDGFYLGAGIGGSFLKNKCATFMKNQNVNRFAGNIFVGYGKVINNHFYVGAEVLLNMASTKTQNAELTKDIKSHANELLGKMDTKLAGKALTDATISATVKNKGITPELSLKIGYVTSKCMFYAKAGLAQPRTVIDAFGSAKDGTEEHKASVTTRFNNVRPIVGVGAARSFGNRWNANVEVAYQFKQKKQILGQDFETNGGPKVRVGVSHTF